GRSSAFRKESSIPIPVDNDSRLHLVRIEQPQKSEPPIFTPRVGYKIDGIIRERRSIDKLLAAEIAPSRTALFVGPPGVGKTMTARWIASELGLPLLILDLAAVMSSFLGRTGNNVRAVLDFAKRQNCVLLLDELDAIAKRRDDVTEIGELKRLVTVLLQEIDEWPSNGILIAATNHSELLDPAVWRRFDNVIEFPKPSRSDVEKAIRLFLGEKLTVEQEWIDILSVVLESCTFSEIERAIMNIRRNSTIEESEIVDEIQKFLTTWIEGRPSSDRISIAERLSSISSLSKRRVSELTRVSRDTLRARKIAKGRNI
ncbi:ATP-binding protein, partial [Nostoc sp. XA013]|nr:ATP-binding protein [Nostoc sp. XA013]